MTGELTLSLPSLRAPPPIDRPQVSVSLPVRRPLSSLALRKARSPWINAAAADGDRTRDLVLTKDALYRLSYSSNRVRIRAALALGQPGLRLPPRRERPEPLKYSYSQGPVKTKSLALRLRSRRRSELPATAPAQTSQAASAAPAGRGREPAQHTSPAAPPRNINCQKSICYDQTSA